jgi:hypothetical protein
MVAGVCLRVALSSTVRAAILSAASLAPLYFSTLSHKRHDFQKKATEHEMCDLIFSETFTRNISHSKRIQRDIVINMETF